MQNYKRDAYNAIIFTSLEKEMQEKVNTLVKSAANAQKVDEHGTWNFEATFDSKGRGSALNWDLYGIGSDHFSGELLIIVQVRQYIKRRKNYFPEIKKSYFLIGTNEDNTTFAHPVESSVIHSAIKREANVIEAVQSWIFGCEYKKVIRQGDLCLIPSVNPAAKLATLVEEKELTLQGSHHIKGVEIRRGKGIFVKSPELFHLPKTHPDVRGLGGVWYKVVVGRRANFYNFAAPTID